MNILKKYKKYKIKKQLQNGIKNNTIGHISIIINSPGGTVEGLASLCLLVQ